MDMIGQWAEELEQVNTILAKLPLDKSIKWGSLVYTYQGKNVVSSGGFKNYFAIWFHNGVFLSDPYKVLVNAQEGKTKSLRQWRFESAEELDEKKILEYALEAIENEKKGLKIKPVKFEPADPPALLSEQLELNPELGEAFRRLTPGKQKEYILYINEAKQEATKLSRIEKIKPLIIAGKGLNDKYK